VLGPVRVLLSSGCTLISGDRSREGDLDILVVVAPSLADPMVQQCVDDCYRIE